MNKFAEQINAGNYAIYWVCVCCLFAREGDGCADDGCHDSTPWGEVPRGADVSAGLLEVDHDDACTDADRADGCDCGVRDFSTSPCDGCGSRLHGARHAFTVVYGMH